MLRAGLMIELVNGNGGRYNVAMTNVTLTPLPGTEPKTEVIEIKPELPAAPITDAEADKAANELGLTFFSASRSRQLKVIGAFQTQVGVINLGVGRLAAADEALQRMLKTAVEISENEDEYVGDRISAILAGRGVVDALQKSIQMMAEFQTEKLISGPTSTKRRAFVDEKPVVPIQAQQVTINLDSQSQSTAK